MNNLEKIKKDILRLSHKDFNLFLKELDSIIWDKKLELDAKSGRLERIYNFLKNERI